MYICIGTHRINTSLIRDYGLDATKSYLTISFTETDNIQVSSKGYDLDVITLELDRVCNPKVLKGKLDENS